MSYDSRVYRVLIASPSDVDEEREIIASVIQAWNDLHSYSRKTVLLPLRWETHTAPAYGTRPQEVINRAIVDECDLLVGIFWTRIGSPSGEADSGTIEEIERVAKAKKPIMLYFSHIEVDPEKINTEQINRLRSFKSAMESGGLIDTVKSRIEFRDKFSIQLEMKIRQLQAEDSSGVQPLALRFLSPLKGEAGNNELSVKLEHRVVADVDSVPEAGREKISNIVIKVTKRESLLPIALAIENLTSQGIRSRACSSRLTSRLHPRVRS
jgi:hypothetical protein